jgi:CDP-paratose 2-epimerase
VKASSTSDTRPVLVTGGAGFIGCNLVDRLCRDGHRVVVYDSLARPGVDANAEWLRSVHAQRFEMVVGDVRDQTRLAPLVAGAKAVFHLAAQVAVTTSLAGPAEDFAVNAAATVGLLEMLRATNREAPLVFASTNKVYGDLGQVGLDLIDDAWAPSDARLRRQGLDEDFPLSFATPYGCSKGAADQYVLDYAHSYGVPSCVLRMSCIYGLRQLGTEDQGWVAHFMLRAVQGKPITLFGDGKQVRDILYVTDAVAAYVAAWKRIGAVSGRAFNLGGGPKNAVSLVQLLAHLETVLGRPIDIGFDEWRQHDQRYFVADSRRAKEAFGLAAPIAWRDGTILLMREIAERHGVTLPGDAHRTTPMMVTA